MPARTLAATPWPSFSTREPQGRPGLAAAVQKHTRWLAVHEGYVATERKTGKFNYSSCS